MSISFNTIPLNLLEPGQYIEFDNSNALQGLPVMPNKVVVIGQSLLFVAVTAGVAVQITDSKLPNQLFGPTSQLALMLNAFKAANPQTEVWAIPLAENGAGTAATGNVTFSGSPTANGTQQLYVNGTLVQAAFTTGMTPAQMATAMQAAIAATTGLPVTCTVDGVTTSKLDFTAVHKGIDAGFCDIRALMYPSDQNVPGVGIAFVAMSGGAGNPVLTTAIANSTEFWFNHWVVPYTDATSILAIQTELDRRFGGGVMMDGKHYGATVGSVGTLGTFGNALNDPNLTFLGLQNPVQAPYIWAAVLGAVASFALSIDPARPLQTLPLPGLLPPMQKDRFMDTERNLLLTDGIATFKVDRGGNVLIDRVVTTYKTNAAGIVDPSYRDIETMATLSYLRYSERQRIAQKFPRYKLADDGTKFGAGQPVVTPSIIRAELIALALEWEDAALVEGIALFKQNLLVQRSSTDVNRVDSISPPNLVNQFRVFAGQIQFIL